MIIDIHQHLSDPNIKNGELRKPINNLSDILFIHEKLLNSFNVFKANIIFNNESFLFSEEVQRGIEEYYKRSERLLLFTFMVDPLNRNSSRRIEALAKNYIWGIKFHSFFQQISEEKFDQVIDLAKFSSDKGLAIIIDGSRNAANFYKFDNLKLLIAVCNAVKTPVIFAHGGSLNVKEAFLIALDNPQLYFDTSFSLSFWQGSSVENDFSFVINKLGPERFLFGTDYPLVDFKKEAILQKRLFIKFGLSQKQIKMIFKENAQNTFGNVMR